MFRNHKFPVFFVSFFLFIYCELLQYDNLRQYALAMLLVSPVLVCWMVYFVVKYGRYDGPDLDEHEFGYQDRSNEELGVF